MMARNLALNKAVRYSRALAGNEGQFAVDGDASSLWSSGNDAPQWIEIDLGQAYEIGGVRLLISQYPAGNTVHRVLGKGTGADELFYELTRFEGLTRMASGWNFHPKNPGRASNISALIPSPAHLGLPGARSESSLPKFPSSKLRQKFHGLVTSVSKR